MGKNSASYKFEKRQKEIARQKKKEEKRQRHQEKKEGKKRDSAVSPDGTPITPIEDLDLDLHLDDSDDHLV